MIEDAELLRRYAEEKSEPAFAELVQRHLGLVYACALRRVGGDGQLAEDVAQQVFADVARRAMVLARRPVLAGWLFTSARFAAAKAMRMARRRLDREQEAHLMHELSQDTAAQFDWDRVRPVLDDAIGELGERDREAILLRFFEGRDYSAVGAKLSLSDNAARMRVDRALEKLRTRLERRGVTSTAAALATALAHQAVVAMPSGLATSVTGAALAGGALATGALAGGGTAAAITFMSITKLQIGIAGALAVAGATGFVIQAETNAGLRREMAGLQQGSQEIFSLRAENVRLEKTAAEVAVLRQDDAALAHLRDEAAALKERLQKMAQAGSSKAMNPAPTAASRVLAEPARQVMARIQPLLPAKQNAPQVITIIESLIPTLPPESYDLSVMLNLEAKLYAATEQWSKAIPPWEKTLQLSETHKYLTDQETLEIRGYVEQLRYREGLTSKPPPPPWF